MSKSLVKNGLNSPGVRSPRTIGAIGMLLIGSMVGWSGCSFVENPPEFEAKLEAQTRKSDGEEKIPPEVKPGKKVRWDGGGVILGDTESLAFTTDSFLETAASLKADRRMASLQDLVQSWPDIALKTLQESTPEPATLPTLQLIASTLDETWCQSPIWQDYVRDVAQLPTPKGESLDARTRFWRYLKNNQPQKALKLRLTRTIQPNHGTMLRAEYHRLEAIAHMMLGDHQESIDQLERTIQLVDNDCPWYASQLQLLLGEFYRHADRLEDWKRTWQSAVVEHSQLADSHGSIDPGFWNRASYLRPAGLPWPPSAIQHLKSILEASDAAGTARSLKLNSDESVVWFAIGFRHLNRAEGQNAVLAFKKAEALERNSSTTDALQLYQARALVAAGQPGAASAILFRLVADHEGTVIADRAQAMLGSMKLQNGSVIQGLNLIQAAQGSLESWPRDEQMRTRADFALALLMRGQEKEGLRQLELARAEFEQAGQVQQVRQCLWNRAKYFEKTGQTKKHRAAAQNLVDFERVAKKAASQF